MGLTEVPSMLKPKILVAAVAVIAVTVVVALAVIRFTSSEVAMDTVSDGRPKPLALDTESEETVGREAEPATGGKSGRPASGSASAPRRVSPNVIPAPPVDTAGLERIAPRDPLTPQPETVPTDPTSWQFELLHRPAVPAAGRFLVGDHTIQVDGITVLEPGQTCGEEAAKWPCGNMALTAFRAWVRGRAVECRVPGEPLTDEITTDCSLSGEDVAEWLVQNGWARSIEDTRFQEAGAYAEANGLGMFQIPPEPEPEKPAGLY